MALVHCLCRIGQRRSHILSGQLRVLLHEIGDRKTFRDETNEGRHGDPCAQDARHTTHDPVIDADPRSRHAPTVRRQTPASPTVLMPCTAPDGYARTAQHEHPTRLVSNLRLPEGPSEAVTANGSSR